MMTAYKAHGFDIADFPNAYHLFENEITLPLNTKMSMEDAEYRDRRISWRLFVDCRGER